MLDLSFRVTQVSHSPEFPLTSGEELQNITMYAMY